MKEVTYTSSPYIRVTCLSSLLIHSLQMVSKLLIQITVLVIAASETSSLDVAVIGAGIGGASASYYIKDLLPDARITVFERGAI